MGSFTKIKGGLKPVIPEDGLVVVIEEDIFDAIDIRFLDIVRAFEILAPSERPAINGLATDGDDILIGSDGIFDVILGRDGNDTIEGRGESDFLAGGGDNDRIRGEGGDDIIGDGDGNDRVFGGDGNDIIVMQGGGLDRYTGGDGFDTFVLSPVAPNDGQADTLKIIDFDAEEDTIELFGAGIASVTELNNRVQIELDGDGDIIDIKGVNDIDDITFVDLFDSDVIDDDGGDIDGGDGDIDGGDGEVDGGDGDGGDFPPIEGVTDIDVPNGQRKVFGTEGDDDIIFNGGELTRAFGEGGFDLFIFADGVTDNGAVDTLKVLDFDQYDDAIGVFREEINSVTELNNRVQMRIGEDNDLLELKGVDSFADIVFVQDLLIT